jgi:hypothetical protein
VFSTILVFLLGVVGGDEAQGRSVLIRNSGGRFRHQPARKSALLVWLITKLIVDPLRAGLLMHVRNFLAQCANETCVAGVGSIGRLDDINVVSGKRIKSSVA